MSNSSEKCDSNSPPSKKNLIPFGQKTWQDVFPVLEKRNLAGLVFFVLLILLAAVTGLVLYLRRKRGEIEREPLTNGPSMSSLQDK